MKLVDALMTLRKTPPDARPLPLALVCGFTPLHLASFLAAHVQSRAPDRKVTVATGLFGDCIGNLERLSTPAPESIVVALEWPDFDPRLGLRNLGGWSPRDLADIRATVTTQVARFEEAFRRAAKIAPLRISLPTLPLPPFAYHAASQIGDVELDIVAHVHQMVAETARLPNVAVVHPQRLAFRSPPGQRHDVAAELATGFPYTMGHASALGEALGLLVLPIAPKKGLITDLDDTLWRGLVGEVGPQGIHWDLDNKSHAHGLYQQMLRSLADTGVLLAAASKNDPAIVDAAFAGRPELAELRNKIFPLEVSWGAKSDAVGRILRAWNVAADSVVFVDDSPLELAEAQAAWPGLTCLKFPTGNDAETYDLVVRLRDLFGKPTLSDDDALRLESLRRAEDFHEEARAAGNADFLAGVNAELSIRFGRDATDTRVFELVNKTNQFNLNGRRYTEGEWKTYLGDPDAWLMTIGYQDKFGPLGTIAAIVGQSTRVDAWVMSCRAFSRRIEHACLKRLFERLQASALTFDFAPTAKNGPCREFFAEILRAEPTGPFSLTREAFTAASPPLHHSILEGTP